MTKLLLILGLSCLGLSLHAQITVGNPKFDHFNYTTTSAVSSAPFSITSEYIDNTGTNLVINWQSMPGAAYQVIASTNVAAASNLWVNVGSPVTAATTNTSATNVIVPPLKFFRVKSP